MLISTLECMSQFSVDHPLWTSILTILVASYFCKMYKNSRLRLPPGPSGLPFLGYLPFLETDVHLQLIKMKNIYGGVISLQLGSQYAVVLNDFKAIKEANNKDEFTGRPPGLFKISDTVNHLGDMNFKAWKESRGFSLNSLTAVGMGKKQVEEMIKEQISKVVDSLAHSTGKSEINLHSHLYESITYTVINLICGPSLIQNSSSYEIVDTYIKKIQEYFDLSSQSFFLPILKPLINLFHPRLKSLKKELSEMEKLMSTEIKTHEKNFDESNLTNYMDFFISEMIKRKNETSTFTRATLNGNSQLLLMAGSDTIRTTIEWTLLYMAKYPQVQERAYQEIVQVLGKERPPSWNDLEALPYVEAIIMEVSRCSTIVPLSAPHWTLADSKVCNYDIPKETYIINNLHAVHMDPNLWEDPEEFKPERFLIENDTKCKAPEYLIPFAYGKRNCPGEELANVSVFLFVTSLLQHFKFLPPSSGLNMEGEFTIVVHPKSPFLKVECRDRTQEAQEGLN